MIPHLGLGVLFVPDDETDLVTSTALELGYRHIDTAQLYHNEAGVGRALVRAGLPCDEIYVTTKLRNGYHEPTRKGFPCSVVETLGLDRVDLFLIHWPLPTEVCTMRAVVVKELGDIDVIKVEEDWAEPVAGAGELLVDVEFAGVNFMDTAARSWGAPHGRLPLIPGVEGAGTVAALGEGVTDFEVGDRVAWVSVWGSYAERLAVPAADAVQLPNYIPTDVAAATMMQGLTSHHFANEVAPLSEGQTALVHAAAGGVGRMLSQQLKLRGARVIGLVSREEKVPVATAAGADEVLISTAGDFVDRVKDLTDGEGVDAVFDGGGESTFRPSLDALRVAGTHVWYGPLIGDIPTVSLFELPKSIRLSYAVYSDHVRTRNLLLEHSNDLFDKIRDGRLRIDISRRYPLSEAKQAHIDITSRGTTGKLLLDTSL